MLIWIFFCILCYIHRTRPQTTKKLLTKMSIEQQKYYHSEIVCVRLFYTYIHVVWIFFRFLRGYLWSAVVQKEDISCWMLCYNYKLSSSSLKNIYHSNNYLTFMSLKATHRNFVVFYFSLFKCVTKMPI